MNVWNRPVLGFRGTCLGGLLLAGSLPGCARLEPAAPLRLWDIPPGVPVVLAPTPETFLPPATSTDPESADHHSARKWIRPDRILAAAISPRRASHDDPFLAWQSPKGNASRPGVERFSDPIIQLPENRFAGNALAGVYNRGPFRPLGLGEANHQIGDLIPFADDFSSQLERLQFALDFDLKSAASSRQDHKAVEAVRSRVQQLLTHARKDMDEGRLAAAHSTAQQAESLAYESGIVFAEGEETPARLVQTLRMRITSDATEQHALPPEQSVESGANPAPPDFTPPKDDAPAASASAVERVPPASEDAPASAPSDGPQLSLPDAPGLHEQVETALAQGSPVGAMPVPVATLPRPVSNPDSPPSDPALKGTGPEDPVEYLPPAPTPENEEESHLQAIPPESASTHPRHPTRMAALADIVGPSSRIDGATGPSLGNVADVPPPADAAEPPAEGPFWPGRESPSGGSAAGRAFAADPAASASTEDSTRVADSSPLSTGNVRWSESPEAIARTRPADRIPTSWLAAIASIAFCVVLAGGIRWLRSPPRTQA